MLAELFPKMYLKAPKAGTPRLQLSRSCLSSTILAVCSTEPMSNNQLLHSRGVSGCFLVSSPVFSFLSAGVFLGCKMSSKCSSQIILTNFHARKSGMYRIVLMGTLCRNRPSLYVDADVLLGNSAAFVKKAKIVGLKLRLCLGCR